MGVLGAAGLGSSMGSVSASTGGAGAPTRNSLEMGAGQLNLGGRLVVGSAGYDTIAAAWDDADDGDVVYVHSSYDAEAAGEKFPIVFDYREKEVALTGGHQSGSEINAEHVPDRNVIEVYGKGPGDYRNTPTIQNLKITGGNVGLLIAGAPNAAFSNLKLFKTQSHGVHITTTSEVDRGSFGNRFYNCEAWSCGGSGFRTDAEASPHGTTFIRCNATWNGWNGNHPGVVLRGYSSVWTSGTIQGNSSYGLYMLDDGAMVVRDTYFESNGHESNHPTQLRLKNTMGATIESCYFQGLLFSGSSLMNDKKDHDNVFRGITLQDARTTDLRNCSFWNHRDGLVALQGAHCRDNDINKASHHAIADRDDLVVHDNGDRTRSGGTVCETDLREVEGKHRCDTGIHDGSGKGSWGPAMWNGSGWVSLIDGKEV